MSDHRAKQKTPISLWKVIILIILIAMAIVPLFGLLIYLLTSGVQQMNLPPIVNLSIFVIISGIFAWLVKRLTDIISGMSHPWFSKDQNDEPS